MTISSVEAGRISAAELEEQGGTIDLLKIVAIFVAEWRTGLVAALLTFALGAAIVLHMPSQFEATAVLLPRDQPAGGNSITAFFTGVRPSSNFSSLLLSRTLRDDVVRRGDLMKRLHATTAESARGALAGMTKIVPGVDTLTVQIRDRDAQLATRIANIYVDALRSMQETMAATQSDVQRHYFEQQIQREKSALLAAEQDLEKMQEGSGMVQMDTQTQIGLNAIANARAQITTLQVRLAALLQSETEQNPEVRTLRSQITQLQAQERSLENGAGGAGAGAAAPAGKMPRVNLEYTRRLREVRYHEALMNSLANHFEELRVGAGNIGDTFDVIDRAVIPEAPTWPPRKLFLLLALGAGLLAGLLAIALRLIGRRVIADPVQRAYLQEIRHSVRRRR